MGRSGHRLGKPENGERKSVLRWLIVSGIILFTIFGAWQLLQLGAACGPSETQAPNFSLKNLEGKTLQLRDFRGQVVVLDFMATWCGPCRASMPGLKALWNEYKGRIVMISISVDPVYDTEERLRNWVDEWGATWMHARDTSDPPVSHLYRITAIPTYVIIDKGGCVQHIHVGLTSEETLSKEIEAPLRE